MSKAVQPLKLLAQDVEDVTIVSAALQDAIAQMDDFAYEPKAHIFRLVFNRYRWEDRPRGPGLRVRTALQIHGVLSAQSKNLKQDGGEAVVSLLSVIFEGEGGEDETPGGQLKFTFSGGGELRLGVECVDMVLADISDPWEASSRPKHPKD